MSSRETLGDPTDSRREPLRDLWTVGRAGDAVDNSTEQVFEMRDLYRRVVHTYARSMCRSIKTLREPYTEHVGPDDVRAAALQYVRKISGFRAPAAHNAAAFDAAVAAVAEATERLLADLDVRAGRRREQPA
jgi:hypothetical protein